MARETTFNDPVRQVVQTVEDQHKYDTPTFRRLEVNARPVNQLVTPASTDALKLAQAFSDAKPELNTWLVHKAKQDEETDIQKGITARNAAGELTDEKATELAKVSSPGYQKGYMRLHGYLAGKADATKMETDWQEDPNRNDITTDEWVKNWYAKNTKGLEDGDFLSTYNKEVLSQADKIRQIGRDEKVADAVQRTDGAVTQYFMRKMTDGNGFNRDTFELSQKDAQEIFGISKAKSDELALAAVNQIIQEGKNPAAAKRALAVFKENKSDGTPGLAFKGKLLAEGTIDKLMREADHVAIQSLEYEDRAARLGREKQREEAIKDMWTTLFVDNNPDGARKKLIQMTKDNPNLFDSKDLYEIFTKVNSQSNKVETNGMKVKSTQMLADALEGKIDVQDVANAVRKGDIAYSSAGTLMSAIKSYRAEDAAVFKSPEFQRANGIINSLPDADVGGLNRDVYQLRKALAKTSLMEYAKTGGKDVVKFAQDLHNSETRLSASGGLDEELKYFVPKYPSALAMQKAIDAGEVIPNDVKQIHLKYFKAQARPEPKPK